MISRTRKALTLVLLLCPAFVPALAQDPLDIEPLRGIVPTGAYSFSRIEAIGLHGGNVMLNIPIVALPPGRAGQSAGLNLIYNSKLWNAAFWIQVHDPHHHSRRLLSCGLRARLPNRCL